MQQTIAKAKLLSAMGIFGTVGIFVRYIPLSSAAIAFCRGVLGALFLFLLMCTTGKKLCKTAIRQNLPILCLSGIALGGNWILLFEAYRHTSVAVATVCYYLAPMILLLVSPLFGERLTAKKLLCLSVALVGMVLVSGVVGGSISGGKGILLGICAAALYASVVLLNKRLTSIAAYDRTIFQLGFSAVMIGLYLLAAPPATISALTPISWVLLIVVGIVHTGIAYVLYFGSIGDLSSHTVAVFSYLDPVIAILLSALLLKEPMNAYNILGSVLILGSALYSELPEQKKLRNFAKRG